MERDTIIEKKMQLNAELDALNKRLTEIDLENKINTYKPFVGKYYKEINEHHKDYECYFYFYDLDETGRLMAMRVQYYTTMSRYFEIEWSDTYDPISSNEHFNTILNECSKEEFLKAYNYINNLINNSLHTNND